EALDGRAHSLLENNEPARALEDFDRALALGISTASIHMGRGQALEALDRLDDALKAYDEVIALEPRNALAHYQKAIGLFHQGDLKASRDSFSRVVELLPLDPAPLRNRANVNLGLKDIPAAIEDWAMLARLMPKAADPHYYLGVLKMGQRRYDEARSEIEAALAREPRHALALLARARLNFWQGNPEKALEDINLVVNEIDPKRAYYLNDRPDVLRALNRLDDALQDCERSITLEPGQLDAYMSLARILQEMGKPDEARLCYDRMIEKNPQNLRAWLLRAEALRDRGAFENALSDCEQARAIDPKSVLPGLVRSGILAAQGHPDQAVEEVERLLRDAPPGDGHILYAAACACAMASKVSADSGDSAKSADQADRAYTLLSDALDRGFHDLNYQEQDRMKTDPALAFLRDQPRFNALIHHRAEPDSTQKVSTGPAPN
ncbi:MAG TPA: tetratricopeptide repeat protein, partial [Isosphaeraceae bacterium]|nr:tetratricopeptide repeat protein [Isosphaeraceae bacterium]